MRYEVGDKIVHYQQGTDHTVITEYTITEIKPTGLSLKRHKDSIGCYISYDALELDEKCGGLQFKVIRQSKLPEELFEI